MRTYSAVAVFLLATTAAWRGADAISFCFEPTEPGCLSMKLGDWDDADFNLCRSEVERFLKALDDWQDCVARDAQVRAKKAVDRFNCYARAERYCL